MHSCSSAASQPRKDRFLSSSSLLWLRLLTFGAILQVTAFFAHALETTLVPANATWKYLDNGSNQGTAWRNPGFDDSAWVAGPAVILIQASFAARCRAAVGWLYHTNPFPRRKPG